MQRTQANPSSVRTSTALSRVIALLLVAAQAHAGGTRVWRLSNFKDFNEGEPDGVRVGTPGEVRPGFASTRVEVDVPSIWSALAAPDGSVWIGTGDEARVLRVRAGKAEQVADLDAVLVTSLAAGDGVVYAGTLPGGAVYAVAPDGTARRHVRLDADHVWALHFDAERATLYAATGPDGVLFAVDAAGKARVHFDSEEKHLLSLISDGHGGLYAGSADEAVLYRVDADGRAFAVHDFPGTELRALARDAAGTVFAAVNEFKKPKGEAPATPPPKHSGTPGDTPTAPAPPPAQTRREGKAALWRVETDGTVERLHEIDKATFHALAVDADGNLWAGSGDEGRVFLVTPDREVYTVLDFEQEHVLALARAGEGFVVGTGDSGALYRVADGPPREPAYLSKAFDAGFPAEWGKLRWRAAGAGALAMDTRSGNTERPGDTWSAWTPLGEGGRGGGVAWGHVRSPAARYLQFRARWTDGAAAALTEAALFYQPRNQRARVTEVSAEDEGGPEDEGAADDAGADGWKQRKPRLKLSWKVENPDGDPLVYRLFFREESEPTWRRLGGPEPRRKTDYLWRTDSVADGTYRVKVVASDERANTEGGTREHVRVSDPILVDNRKPEVLGLAARAGVLAGRAVDATSPVRALEYAVDANRWLPLAPLDGLVDDLVEAFRVELPKDLEPGPHTVAVRALDMAGNVGVNQITFNSR